VFTHNTKNASAELVMHKIEAFLQDGKKFKAIRCDRDSVFMSQKTQHFLHEHHVSHQPTSWYTPQENGNAERVIDVLKERMQCLLSDSGLSDALWAEALWHACYLQNITPSTGATTPWELLKGEKPDATALRIWGCVAWKLIPADTRRKSADTRKSEKVRYVGIAWPNPKAHRVLSQRGIIYTTRHLALDESARPACDSRADFTPILELEVSVPAPPPAPVIQPPATTASPAPSST
jgi:hypothetical protein